jgi:hypothetical protein
MAGCRRGWPSTSTPSTRAMATANSVSPYEILVIVNGQLPNPRVFPSVPSRDNEADPLTLGPLVPTPESRLASCLLAHLASLPGAW